MQKPRICCVAVFHRGALSLGAENRQNLGEAIYHWAILIRPKDISHLKESIVVDATDGVRQDPVTDKDLNPTHEWFFRVREGFDPLATANFLGAVNIGTLPRAPSIARIREMLEGLPLPRKDRRPFENCVSWAKQAIVMMQMAELVDSRPVDEIMAAGMALGGRIIANGLPQVEEERFPGLPSRKKSGGGTLLGRIKGLIKSTHQPDESSSEKAEQVDASGRHGSA
ncbi:uncharacterized protein K489DRAFT_270406 [Dissoconium aciculare CBS 342.82]|jgi:hypothetical protein|uniref:Uncharacterized protein n=1 Tax=Dissoconium aciculare CBS 342.82 TaxID=1314786 RepID=A0A6J3M179_9PEZI|nr:uncharacterized protein K489DRAFT_270406 [Dissoconium aciculare CBS 342.82]KAF1821259.1 hypothetical protein K489DRAFT_270406 [Dissoconium aciculare CBS 342.82]